MSRELDSDDDDVQSSSSFEAEESVIRKQPPQISMDRPGPQFNVQKSQPAPQQPSFMRPQQPDSDDSASEVSSQYSEEMDDAEKMQKKRKYLLKIREYSRKLEDVGYARNLTMQSSLMELEIEYKALKKQYDVENCTKLMGKLLVGSCTVIEKGNSFLDTGMKLDGWSTEIAATIDDPDEGYETELKEIYEKYYDNFSEIAPEIRLGGKLLMSAIQYNVSQQLNVPDAVRNDPEVQAAINRASQRQMNNINNSQQVQNFNNMMNAMPSYDMGAQQAPTPRQPARKMKPMDDEFDVDNILGSIENDVEKISYLEQNGKRTLNLM